LAIDQPRRLVVFAFDGAGQDRVSAHSVGVALEFDFDSRLLRPVLDKFGNVCSAAELLAMKGQDERGNG
jgi:hypothetical protein